MGSYALEYRDSGVRAAAGEFPRTLGGNRAQAYSTSRGGACASGTAACMAAAGLSSRSQDVWLTMAHELGHGLNGRHTFGLGGRMSYTNDVPFAATGWVLVLFSILFGLATSSRDVLLPLAIADAFGTRSFAQVYGLMILAFVPGGAIGPLVLAEAHRVFGHYRPGFMACLALTSLAVVALAFLPRGREAQAA